MKKLLAIVSALVTTASFTPFAFADDHSQDTLTYVAPNTGWKVAYHSAPSTESPIVNWLHSGLGEEALLVDSSNPYWYGITVNGQEDYITTNPTFTHLVTVEAPWKVEADQLISAAKTQLGVPYWLDHQVPYVGFDCSNFVAWSYKQIGIPFSGASQWQRYNLGIPVPLSDIREGDVLFFATAGDPAGGGHVGIYMGDGRVIQCGGGWKKVTIEPLATTWLGRNLVFARRVIQ